jgi:hypothetical protein
MNVKQSRIIKEERGQSLVIVLLMIVIAVVIAVAISFRTIQDIRRSGEERASARAGTQVESMLDVVTSPGIMVDVNAACDTTWASGDTCCLNSNDLEGLGVDMAICEDAEVCLRPEDTIEDILVPKDDVFELRLDGVGSAEDFCVGWDDTAGSTVDYVTVKVYKTESDCSADGEGHMDCTDEAVALTHGSGATNWSSEVVNVAADGCGTVSFSADAVVARIKPIGGSARITITSLPSGIDPHVATAKAYCYTQGADGEDIYREFVRRLRLHAAVPSCFDYVLYSGEGDVNKYR